MELPLCRPVRDFAVSGVQLHDRPTRTYYTHQRPSAALLKDLDHQSLKGEYHRCINGVTVVIREIGCAKKVSNTTLGCNKKLPSGSFTCHQSVSTGCFPGKTCPSIAALMVPNMSSS